MVKEQCVQLSRVIPNLFNEEQYSDLKVVFPQSNHTLHLHRNIICSSSDFFKACLSHEMKESNEGGIVTMSEEDDEELMTEMFRACYRFEIDIPNDNTRIVPLIQLAQKYQFNSLLPTLVSHLVRNMDLKTNMLQCLHLDLDSDAQLKEVKKRLEVHLQKSSVKILEGNSYLTLDFLQWRNALQMMVNRENRLLAYDAIQSWIMFDAENRSAHSLVLSNMVKDAALKKPMDTASFDPEFCGSRATLSHDRKRIKTDGRRNARNCSAMGISPCKEFSVRLLGNCKNLMIGVASRTNTSFQKESENFGTCGWYLYCCNGNLYSQNGDLGTPYMDQLCFKDGTVIGVKLSDSGELSFSVNEVSHGVAFRGLPTDELYPAFDMYNSRCEFEFL